MSPTIVWFRLDLRLADNPALRAAMERGGPIVPLFIWSPEDEGKWAPGAASRWWLHQSLQNLTAALRGRGGRLILRRGPAGETLREVIAESRADAIFWNRRYEPALVSRDRKIKSTLRNHGLRVETFNSALLFEPWTVHTHAGNPFQVFTPFWKACLKMPSPSPPLDPPDRIRRPKQSLRSVDLDSLELEPRIDWAKGIRRSWQAGESGAARRLEHFLDDAFSRYPDDRNRPDHEGSSRLSPHLHFGEISPRQIWHALERRAALDDTPGIYAASEIYLRELGWREFAHHLLFHLPATAESPLRAEFRTFPWETNHAALEAWQRGRTGYPIVDAGMRELWTTGWMHNRVRMIVASFLVKDLLLPWQRGAEWFWDTLVDADLANNTLGWQWTAGCGADAAPYFRIFNPVSQGEKFDLDGDYVRRWVPELSRLPAAWIQQPWNAPAEVLKTAGVVLGTSYPAPIVDHAVARRAALEAFETIKRNRGED